MNVSRAYAANDAFGGAAASSIDGKCLWNVLQQPHIACAVPIDFSLLENRFWCLS